MYLIAIAAMVAVLVVWRGRSKPLIRRGEWRAGAALFAIGTLSAAAIMAVKGNGEEALGLLTVGGVLLFAARTPRGDPQPARPRKPQPKPPPGAPRDSLSVNDARSILGVSAEATAEDIRRAHARLMITAHPDHGGTNRHAALLNAARDRLLKSSS